MPLEPWWEGQRGHEGELDLSLDTKLLFPPRRWHRRVWISCQQTSRGSTGCGSHVSRVGLWGSTKKKKRCWIKQFANIH